MPNREHLPSNIFYLAGTDIDLEILSTFNYNLERLSEVKESLAPDLVFSSLSMRSLKKFVMTGEFSLPKKMLPADFIEVIDYDPVRDSALASGKNKPPDELPLHWLTYHALPVIGAIAVIAPGVEPDKLAKIGVPGIGKELKKIGRESAMEILPFIKDNKRLNLGQGRLVFFSGSIPDLISDIIHFYREIKEINGQPSEKNKGEENEGEDRR